MGAATTTVRVLITGNADVYVAATDAATGANTKLSASMDETSKKSDLSKSALLGLTGAVVGIGAAALIMGDKYDTAHALMTAAINAAGQAHVPYQAELNATTEKMQQLGFSSVDVDNAMAASVVSTQNVKTSMGLMGLAADIARAKHVSLGDAVSAVDKLYAGSNRALTQMGINLDIGSGKLSGIQTATEAVSKAQLGLKTTEDEISAGTLKGAVAADALKSSHMSLSNAEQKLKFDQDAVTTSLDALSTRLGGQASTYAGTFTGRLDVLRAQGENLASSLGTKLLPAVEDLTTIIISGATWLDHNKEVLILLAGIVTGVALPAAVAYTTALYAQAAAFIAANAPMLLVIATIAAIGAAIYELYTHWSEIWGEIKKIFDDAVSFLRSGFGTFVVMLTGPFAPLIELGLHWQTVWGTVKSVISDVWSFIKPIFDAIVGSVKDVTNAISGIANVASKVGGVGKSVLTLGGLLADGGPASAGVPYIVGEQGPELFVPNVSGVVVPNGPLTAGASGAAGAASASSASGGDVTIELYLDSTQFATATATAMRTALLQQKRVKVSLGLT